MGCRGRASGEKEPTALGGGCSQEEALVPWLHKWVGAPVLPFFFLSWPLTVPTAPEPVQTASLSGFLSIAMGLQGNLRANKDRVSKLVWDSLGILSSGGMSEQSWRERSESGWRRVLLWV